MVDASQDDVILRVASNSCTEVNSNAVPCPRESTGNGGGARCICSKGTWGIPDWDIPSNQYVSGCTPCMAVEHAAVDATFTCVGPDTSVVRPRARQAPRAQARVGDASGLGWIQGPACDAVSRVYKTR